jgi:hypothetical protein
MNPDTSISRYDSKNRVVFVVLRAFPLNGHPDTDPLGPHARDAHATTLASVNFISHLLLHAATPRDRMCNISQNLERRLNQALGLES